MPIGQFVDTHLHLWDTTKLRYPWLDANSALNRSFLLKDFHAATAGLPIEAMVFVQCEADYARFEDEARWATEQALQDPRIRGLVAWAPLEKGDAVCADLARLKQNPLLRGIRRIIQFEPDLEFCLQPAFLAGLRALTEFQLSFDICIDHRHFENVLRLVDLVPEVPLILDHIGKPPIARRQLYPWTQQLHALAEFPNVVCKISGVATEADHKTWTSTDLIPFITAAIETFGFERVMFGGDWPVSTQAIRYEQWISLLDDILVGVNEGDQRKFWRDNAIRTYRLGSLG